MSRINCEYCDVQLLSTSQWLRHCNHFHPDELSPNLDGKSVEPIVSERLKEKIFFLAGQLEALAYGIEDAQMLDLLESICLQYESIMNSLLGSH